MDRPDSGSHVIDPGAHDWRPTADPGFWEKALLDDGNGSRTTLMRLDAGAHTGLHHHAELEEILVLDGEFSDQDRTYGPGEYCIRAPGVEHTSSSIDGCTVLLVYRP